MNTDSVIPAHYARILTWCERRPGRALALIRRLVEHTPPDGPDHAWAQLVRGWSLLARADLDLAVVVLETAQAQFTRLKLALGVVRSRHGVLFAAFLRGAPAEHQEDWKAIASALEAHGCHREAVQAHLTRLRHLNVLGRSQEVLVLADSVAEAVARHGGLAEQALLERTVGIAQLQVGDFPTARRGLEHAAAHFIQLKHPVELARTRFELARLAHAQEDYDTELDLLQQARATFARLPFPMWVALIDKSLGLTEAKRGRPDQAIAAQLSARAVFLALDMPFHSAECDLNLGNAAFHSGLYALALATWYRAEAQFSALAAHGRVLIARRNRAEALTRLGQLDDAQTLLQSLLPIAEELDARTDRGEILQNLGEVLYSCGDSAAALVYLQQAERLFMALPNRAGVARSRLTQALIQLERGELVQAVSHFQQAAQDLAGNPLFQWQAVYGLGRCAEMRGEPYEALNYYRQATATVVRLRKALAEEYASSALFREAAALITDTIRLTAAYDTPLAALELSEQQRSLALHQQILREPITFPPALHGEYELRRAKLQSIAMREERGPELDQALADYFEILFHGRHALPTASELDDQPFELDLLLAALHTQFGDAWTVIVYLQNQHDLLAITLEPAGSHCTIIPLDLQLRKMIERTCLPRYRIYTFEDIPFQAGQRLTPWADLKTLGAQLIPPAARVRLHPDHRLLIVPGGPLHNLPWSALRIDEEWLVERAVIQLIPGLHIWTDLIRHPIASDNALLLGVNHFGERAPGLPSALPSLDLAQRHWPGNVQRLVNEEATRARLREAAVTGELQRYGLVHVATHGQLMTDMGILAHLKLADDDLLVDEVAQLRFGGALVILVACEGALGETLPGEEHISLTWALLAAGARDVIASLWKLYDLTVLPLLEPLYTGLAAGLDPPLALAQAQRFCIAAGREQADLPLGKPLIWASLCATGAG